jgi:hypothetical protein
VPASRDSGRDRRRAALRRNCALRRQERGRVGLRPGPHAGQVGCGRRHPHREAKRRAWATSKPNEVQELPAPHRVQIPANITGSGQARGNSGVFLASTGPGDDGYELQVLDSYNNTTYVNGQGGSIYKQSAPLVNPARKPGEWQSYDVVWTAPTFQRRRLAEDACLRHGSSTACWCRITLS